LLSITSLACTSQLPAPSVRVSRSGQPLIELAAHVASDWLVSVAARRSLGPRGPVGPAGPVAPVSSDASLPSTLSALRPVATPAAFAGKGLPGWGAGGFPGEITPPVAPSEANSNARPPARFDALRQGAEPSAVPLGVRQP